ncbi:hypothetical protein ONS95_007501 [Cadophora gregata]|uniref:uncharacterized protein n=1 Tax=Cadophora gregata TaxID=51156 RepID=UPI0026DD9FFA|nr:uncharacterized protein ONS95_007501 [Cadophora gregata]KAK0125873.1 hypothetical protein ONS95_007501 [Cadophora gregata]
MGSMLSNTKRYENDNHDGMRRGSSVTKNGHDLRKETSVGEMDGLRFADLMHALQKISSLQREATSARIEARQKRREAAFKRQEVWIWDGKFMGEIQKLSASGNLAGFEELQRLALSCQSARDDLGPLEQEGTEAEQCWEGQIYILRQAEERLYNEFNREFSVAHTYPSAASSDVTSQYGSLTGTSKEDKDESTPNIGRMIIPHRISGSVASTSSLLLQPLVDESSPHDAELRARDIILPGLEGITAEIGDDSTGSDVGDINGSLDGLPEDNIQGPPQPLPERSYSSLELYPHLVLNFKSKRDRINKWLEGNILESHLEATSLYSIVKTQLAAEHKPAPSNWSQLVIAYWELDGAANVRFGHEKSSFASSIQQIRTEAQYKTITKPPKQNENNQEYGTGQPSERSMTFDAVNLREQDAERERRVYEPTTDSRSLCSGPLIPPSPPQSQANSEMERYDERKHLDIHQHN